MTLFETIINALDLDNDDELITFSGAVIKLVEDDGSSCPRFEILKEDDEYCQGDREWINLEAIDFSESVKSLNKVKKEVVEIDDDKDWNYAVAEKLRVEAVNAREAFNQYIARKPKIEFSNL